MLRTVSAMVGRLVIMCVIMALAFGIVPASGLADEQKGTAQKKSIRKMCGTCPDGYATTGITEAPEICKDGDPTLVQCVPLGANTLGVCGSCPEGYNEIGSSSVPARCGSNDGGRLAQCQLSDMSMSLPNPGEGMRTCPPDCGTMGTPGQGDSPPPPKYQRVPGRQ